MSTYQLTYPAGQALPASGLLRAAAAASLAIPLLLAGTQATRLVAQPSSGAYVPFTKQTASQAYQALSLAFEPNVGQAPKGTQFLARTSGYEAFLGRGGVVLALPGQHRAGQAARMTLVRMAVVGASPAATLVGLDRQPGITNYLVGNGTGFHTNVPNFAQVAYNNVYPGISMTYSGTRGGLEYSFTSQPGANPATIRLAFPGVQGMTLDRQGDLLLRTATSTIVERAPRAFQGSTVVPSRFVKLGPNTVGFSVGAYDHSKALTIDPTIVPSTTGNKIGGGFSRFVGGSGDDAAYAIALDKAGNAYITGATYSPGPGTVLFPVVPATGELQSVNNTTNAASNAFVTKLAPQPTTAATPPSPAGGTIIYSTYLGGNGVAATVQQLAPGLTNGLVAPALPNAGDVGFGIAVDASGNAYVTGETFSATTPTAAGLETGTGFPVTNETAAGITTALQITNNGNASGNNAPNAFVSVLNPTGASLLFSDVWGGAGISCTTGTPATTPAACTAGDGTSVHAQGGGGTTGSSGLGEAGLSIALDGATPPNIYIGGESFSAACPTVGVTCAGGGSAAFPMGTVVGQTINNGFHGNTATAGGAVSNGFLAKFTLHPGAVVTETSTFFGGSGTGGLGDAIQAIALDPTFAGASATAPDVIATGFANSTTTFPLPTGITAFQLKSGGGTDAFVAAFSNGLINTATSFLGGTGADMGNAVAVDNLGNIVVGGQTASGDTEPGEVGFPGGVDFVPAGLDNDGETSDGFVTSLNPTLTALNYSDLIGGNDGDTSVQGLAIDGTGSAYFTGWTTSVTLPVKNALTGMGALRGTENAIVGKLTPRGGLSFLTYLGGSNTDAGFGIAVDSIGAAYVAGATDSPNFPNNTVASAAPTFTTGEPFNGGGAAAGTTPFDAFVTEVAPKENLVTPTTGGTQVAVPICAVVAAVVGSNSRLGAAVVYPTHTVFPDVPSTGGTGFFPAIGYLSFQVSAGTTAASAVARSVEQFSTPGLGQATITSCSVGTNNLNFLNGTTPVLSTLTFTGTIFRVRGSQLLLAPGDAIVVTFTQAQGKTVAATVTDTTKGITYTLASLPFSSLIVGTF